MAHKSPGSSSHSRGGMRQNPEWDYGDIKLTSHKSIDRASLVAMVHEEIGNQERGLKGIVLARDSL